VEGVALAMLSILQLARFSSAKILTHFSWKAREELKELEL
jgi:hypothetical protein